MPWAGEKDMVGAAEALAVRLPDSLAPFARLAYNYRWSWTPGGDAVFEAIDPYRWALRRENPVRLLLETRAETLTVAARNPELVRRAESILGSTQGELDRPVSAGSAERPVAFFCAEYGIHRSLPTYSGGLGVLAGDILKEASDRALPMVGVGILYRQGNFRQRIDGSGWQSEYWIEADPDRLPAALVTGDDGLPVRVSVRVWDRVVSLQIWRVDVGRVPLYLLDAQLPENSRIDRWITARLYVGDRRFRLAQYTVLGQGGVRALRALGIDPSVIHLNEGHAALAPIEIAREEVEAGHSLDEALGLARERTVFTTHTPVPAGNETYTEEELEDIHAGLSAALHAEEPVVMRLGRSRPEDGGEPLGLTVLGLRMSRTSNAVSRVHGRVTRVMWRHIYPDRPVDEVPIGHVTNGVHIPSWMAPAMRRLLDRYLEKDWNERADDPAVWEGVDDIPDEELWAVRGSMRTALVRYVQDRSVGDRLARGDPLDFAQAGARRFDPSILTVGFARRVAAYKRLHLLIHNRHRGLRMFEDGVQLVLAGKAHPQDAEAKQILQSVFALRHAPETMDRAVYLEDYDMGMALHLVSGCDVWINVPRPPLEASGTSGMKAAMNGGLNLSILDGWWEEAHDGENGWGIRGDESIQGEEGDRRDADALYDLLEREVIPLFYSRGQDGIPRGWIRRVKHSLRTIGPRYGAARMMREYARNVYGLS